MPATQAPEPGLPIPEPSSPIPASAPRRILAVDDNRDSAPTLAMMLTLRGHETRIALDGEAALQVAESFRPDTVLLDIGLPKLNGYEACRRIRGQPWGKDLLIIALTGWGQETDKARAREAGFDFHLVKPVDPPELERLLQSAGR